VTTLDEVEAARSLLFVPASRPDRFERARDSGTDLVILDLEDAVPPEGKVAALENVQRWLARDAAATVVRVNGVGSAWHAAELDALAGLAVAVMVPKAESAQEIAALIAAMPGSPVIALVETPRGVLDADSIAGVAGVTRLALGNVDLAAALGVNPASRTALWRARSELVLASAAHGIAGPVDGVTTALDDADRLNADVRHAVALGFTAKLCIHPRQVAVVNAGWQPTAADAEWARRVLTAEGQGAVAVDGEMVDGPVLLRARMILGRIDESLSD
jgi:citrate lyase subunit beta/citryl-CoA lyase